MVRANANLNAQTIFQTDQNNFCYKMEAGTTLSDIAVKIARENGNESQWKEICTYLAKLNFGIDNPFDASNTQAQNTLKQIGIDTYINLGRYGETVSDYASDSFINDSLVQRPSQPQERPASMQMASRLQGEAPLGQRHEIPIEPYVLSAEQQEQLNGLEAEEEVVLDHPGQITDVDYEAEYLAQVEAARARGMYQEEAPEEKQGLFKQLFNRSRSDGPTQQRDRLALMLESSADDYRNIDLTEFDPKEAFIIQYIRDQAQLGNHEPVKKLEELYNMVFDYSYDFSDITPELVYSYISGSMDRLQALAKIYDAETLRQLDSFPYLPREIKELVQYEDVESGFRHYVEQRVKDAQFELSSLNPFIAHLDRTARDDLASCYTNNDIEGFETILRENGRMLSPNAHVLLFRRMEQSAQIDLLGEEGLPESTSDSINGFTGPEAQLAYSIENGLEGLREAYYAFYPDLARERGYVTLAQLGITGQETDSNFYIIEPQVPSLKPETAVLADTMTYTPPESQEIYQSLTDRRLAMQDVGLDPDNLQLASLDDAQIQTIIDAKASTPAFTEFRQAKFDLLQQAGLNTSQFLFASFPDIVRELSKQGQYTDAAQFALMGHVNPSIDLQEQDDIRIIDQQALTLAIDAFESGPAPEPVPVITAQPTPLRQNSGQAAPEPEPTPEPSPQPQAKTEPEPTTPANTEFADPEPQAADPAVLTQLGLNPAEFSGMNYETIVFNLHQQGNVTQAAQLAFDTKCKLGAVAGFTDFFIELSQIDKEHQISEYRQLHPSMSMATDDLLFQIIRAEDFAIEAYLKVKPEYKDQPRDFILSYIQEDMPDLHNTIEGLKAEARASAQAE